MSHYTTVSFALLGRSRIKCETWSRKFTRKTLSIRWVWFRRNTCNVSIFQCMCPSRKLRLGLRDHLLSQSDVAESDSTTVTTQSPTEYKILKRTFHDAVDRRHQNDIRFIPVDVDGHAGGCRNSARNLNIQMSQRLGSLCKKSFLVCPRNYENHQFFQRYFLYTFNLFSKRIKSSYTCSGSRRKAMTLVLESDFGQNVFETMTSRRIDG